MRMLGRPLVLVLLITNKIHYYKCVIWYDVFVYMHVDNSCFAQYEMDILVNNCDFCDFYLGFN